LPEKLRADWITPGDPKVNSEGNPMIRRAVRNGLVAAFAAVAVFPVTAVASTGPAVHTPGTLPQIWAPSWYAAAPQAPKAHTRHHITPHTRHHVTHHARHHVPASVRGRVTTHHLRLHVRSGPGTGYRIVGSRPPGRVVALTCKKRGSNVLGNNRWYKLAHAKGYVSARYVHNRSAVRWC